MLVLLSSLAHATEIVSLAVPGQAVGGATIAQAWPRAMDGQGNVWIEAELEDGREAVLSWSAAGGLVLELAEGDLLPNGQPFGGLILVQAGTDGGFIGQSHAGVLDFRPGLVSLITEGEDSCFLDPSSIFDLTMGPVSWSGKVWFGQMEGWHDCADLALAVADPPSPLGAVMLSTTPVGPELQNPPYNDATFSGSYLDFGAAHADTVVVEGSVSCTGGCASDVVWRIAADGSQEVVFVDDTVATGAEDLGPMFDVTTPRGNALGDLVAFGNVGLFTLGGDLLVKRLEGTGTWTEVARAGDAFSGFPHPIELFRAPSGYDDFEREVPRALVFEDGSVLFTVRAEEPSAAHGCLVLELGGTLQKVLCSGDTLDGPGGTWTLDTSLPPDVLIGTDQGRWVAQWSAEDPARDTHRVVIGTDDKGIPSVLAYRGQVLGTFESHDVNPAVFGLPITDGGQGDMRGMQLTDNGEFLLQAADASYAAGAFLVRMDAVPGAPLEVEAVAGWTAEVDGGETLEVDITLTNTSQLPIDELRLVLTSPTPLLWEQDRLPPQCTVDHDAETVDCLLTSALEPYLPGNGTTTFTIVANVQAVQGDTVAPLRVEGSGGEASDVDVSVPYVQETDLGLESVEWQTTDVQTGQEISEWAADRRYEVNQVHWMRITNHGRWLARGLAVTDEASPELLTPGDPPRFLPSILGSGAQVEITQTYYRSSDSKSSDFALTWTVTHDAADPVPGNDTLTSELPSCCAERSRPLPPGPCNAGCATGAARPEPASLLALLGLWVCARRRGRR